jgi:hypothetical protein
MTAIIREIHASIKQVASGESVQNEPNDRAKVELARLFLSLPDVKLSA